jgi:hypothetical protein
VNPIWNFIILKKKKKSNSPEPEGKKKKNKKTPRPARPSRGSRWPAARCLVVGEILPARPSPSVQTHLSGEPKKPDPRWVALAGRGWPVVLLSFSQIISLSLLNDKKKEEEAWERSAGGNGREEEMEGRRRKKKKFSALECRIIL